MLWNLIIEALRRWLTLDYGSSDVVELVSSRSDEGRHEIAESTQDLSGI